MKHLLLGGCLAALLTGAAFAQSATGVPPAPLAGQPDAPSSRAAGGPLMTQADPDAPPPGGGRMRPPPPPPGGPRAMDDDAGGPPPPHGGRHGPPPSRAAHFHLQRGDFVLDVKCADDQPVKDCADVAIQMLDRAQPAAPAKP